MALVFWCSVALVAYVYVGYPILLWFWARVRPAPELKLGPTDDRSTSGAGVPGVSIVIAARNEARRLPARLTNLLALDYPASRRQIIVVSDGSTDDTLDVLARFRGLVEAVALPPGGKALALNAAVARARFEIVVFADARQTFAPDALGRLVAPFADPRVGAVTGELRLDCESALFANRRTIVDRRLGGEPRGNAGGALDRREVTDRRSIASTIADGLGMYWRYEKRLRQLESRVASTLGATGAIYALRRSLWRPLPPNTILDDVLAPMRVVLAGYRVVFSEHALAWDRAPADADTESRRKVRTLAGNYQILRLEPGLLLPWRNPVWVQYVSHKVGRLAVPYALLAIFSTSIVLAGQHAFYMAALTAQVAFYLLAAYGALLELGSRREAAGPARTRANRPAPEALRAIR
jgi:cellulose synthase/poly-beta-1,6-N-acetylglucosamine synthase-like glycosyltransferase